MTLDEKRKYDRDWYARNKTRILEQKRNTQKANSDKRRVLVLEYLSSHPCVDCGETDPVVLEFDHIDPTTKSGSVSNLIGQQASARRLLSEINKCRVVCANCHRRRTAVQFNWYSRIESML